MEYFNKEQKESLNKMSNILDKMNDILNDASSESRSVGSNEGKKKICPKCHGSCELAGGLVECHVCSGTGQI